MVRININVIIIIVCWLEKVAIEVLDDFVLGLGRMGEIIRRGRSKVSIFLVFVFSFGDIDEA